MMFAIVLTVFCLAYMHETDIPTKTHNRANQFIDSAPTKQSLCVHRALPVQGPRMAARGAHLQRVHAVASGHGRRARDAQVQEVSLHKSCCNGMDRMSLGLVAGFGRSRESNPGKAGL